MRGKDGALDDRLVFSMAIDQRSRARHAGDACPRTVRLQMGSSIISRHKNKQNNAHETEK